MTVQPKLKALVTLAEAASYLGQNPSNYSAAQADSLQRLINAVSAAMDRHCRTNLVKASTTEFYDGGSKRIVLRRTGIDTGAPFEVQEDGVLLERAADGRSTTDAGNTPGYWLDPEACIIERNGTWARGQRVVAVTYTSGWATQFTTGNALRTDEAQELVSVDGPDDLREACLIIIKAHTDLGPANFGVQVIGDNQVLRPDSWPRTALKFLDFYRA